MQGTMVTKAHVLVRQGDPATGSYHGVVVFETDRLNGRSRSAPVAMTLAAPYEPRLGFVGSHGGTDVVERIELSDKVSGVDADELLEAARTDLNKQYAQARRYEQPGALPDTPHQHWWMNSAGAD